MTKMLSVQSLPSAEEVASAKLSFIELLAIALIAFAAGAVFFDTITFDSIGLTLSVEEIYHRVKNDNVKKFLEAKQSTAEQ